MLDAYPPAPPRIIMANGIFTAEAKAHHLTIPLVRDLPPEKPVPVAAKGAFRRPEPPRRERPAVDAQPVRVKPKTAKAAHAPVPIPEKSGTFIFIRVAERRMRNRSIECRCSLCNLELTVDMRSYRRGKMVCECEKPKLSQAAPLPKDKRLPNVCGHGHEYTAENTLLRTAANGKTHRECRACQRRHHELRRIAAGRPTRKTVDTRRICELAAAGLRAKAIAEQMDLHEATVSRRLRKISRSQAFTAKDAATLVQLDELMNSQPRA